MSSILIKERKAKRKLYNSSFMNNKKVSQSANVAYVKGLGVS